MAEGKLALVYFDGTGRAEVARLLLNAAGREFEDRRLDGAKGWPEYKPQAPYGILPVLEVDDERYGESHGINRFLARELGFFGKTNKEGLRIDEVQGIWEDALQKGIKIHFEKDETKKAENKKEFDETSGPKFQGHLEKILKNNGTGFFVGESISLAEFYAFDMHVAGKLSEYIGPLDNFPLLKANVEKVKQNPGIAAYLASKKK